ncbi:unnamed protein product [marine sediment metagenome]|uniref:Uncharacterized protein n=1 Tax=marine sediment metagenome TaxID=412755 RepID=X1UI78_9ZZZZ
MNFPYIYREKKSFNEVNFFEGRGYKQYFEAKNRYPTCRLQRLQIQHFKAKLM